MSEFETKCVRCYKVDPQPKMGCVLASHFDTRMVMCSCCVDDLVDKWWEEEGQHVFSEEEFKKEAPRAEKIKGENKLVFVADSLVEQKATLKCKD